MTITNGSAPQIRNDGALVNVLTGMGTERDKSLHTAVGYAPQLDQWQQMQLAQDVFIGRICAAKPDAATRKWCEITFDDQADEKILNAFNQYRDTIGGKTEDEELISDREIFNLACYLANVHRGAAIVLDVDDGNPPDQPIDTKNIRSIVSAQVLDSYKIFPDTSASYNPFDVSHYEIVVPSQQGQRLVTMFDRATDRVRKKTNGSLGYLVHRSRVLRIPGVRIPPDAMLLNLGWDRSLIEQIWEKFRDWNSMYSDVGNLVHDYSLFVYALAGLRDMVSEGQEDALRSRFQALRMMTSSMGGVAIDAEDEKMEFLQRQFGGIDAVMDKFRDMLIGASGVPHTVLFGESPSGLGATGESEEKTWADAVEEYQTRVILPRLRRLYRLIWLAKDGPTGGKEPQGWGISFLPLRQQTEEERLAGLSSFVNSITALKNAEILLPEEGRIPFKGDSENYRIKLDEDLWQKKQQEQQQSLEGFSDFTVGEPPAEEQPTEEPATDEFAIGEEPTLDSIRFDASTRVFADEALHQQALKETRQKFKIFPSAYASMWLAKRYRELFKQKHGTTSGRYKSSRKDDTREWLKEKWVRISSTGEILGACGDRSEKEGKPKCLPQAKAQSMSKQERIASVRKKRREDPDPERSGAAKNVATQPE